MKKYTRAPGLREKEKRKHEDKVLPRASLVHFFNYLAKMKQEEEDREASPVGRWQSFGGEILEYSRVEEKIQVTNYVDGKSGGTDPPDSMDGSDEDVPRREGQEAEVPLAKESNSKGRVRRYSGRNPLGR